MSRNRFPIAISISRCDRFQPTDFGPPDEHAGPTTSRSGFLALPTEIVLLIGSHLPIRSTLSLMATSKSFRSILIPNANALASSHVLLSIDEGGGDWCIPVSGEERDYWKQTITELEGTTSMDRFPFSQGFPWFAYVRCCADSWSMRNRMRIMGSLEDFERYAVDIGVAIPK